MKLGQVMSTPIRRAALLAVFVMFIPTVAMGSDALFVGVDGNVGVGTGSPSVSLHVLRDDGTSLIRVEEINATTTPRSMLELRNNGPIGFNMDNLADDQWRFAVQTTGFRISRAGSGGPEFEVLDNGDAVLAGTLTENSDINVKKSIETLDGDYVLARLEQVPVSEWSYKVSPDSRHIGPMAQDFHAAFGLGADDKHISPRDMAGVNMAAIKALKAENEALKRRLAKLEALIQAHR